MERIPYDPVTIFGSKMAEAINNLIRAEQMVTRVVFAAETAMAGDTAANTKNIEGGDFGVIASTDPQAPVGAQGAKYWAAIVRIRGKLEDADFLTDLRSLDMGGQ